MTTTVAHEAGDETRRADAVYVAIACKGARRRCADNPAGRGGGRLIIGRGAQDEPERVAGRGGEREPPRRHLIDAARAQFADDDADGAAAQRLLHRPQHVETMRSGDRDQVLGSVAALLEAGSVG